MGIKTDNQHKNPSLFRMNTHSYITGYYITWVLHDRPNRRFGQKQGHQSVIYAWDISSTVSLHPRRKKTNKQKFWDTNQRLNKKRLGFNYFENLMDCWSLNESPLFFFQCDKQLKTVKAEKNKWSKEWIWKGKSQ